MTTSPQTASMIHPAALMRIGNMELRARSVVEGFYRGIHRSPFHGSSVEFTEYRDYTPGDDTRYIDWRLYARSDRLSVRKFEGETNLHAYMLVDQSRSMSFGSLGYSKAEYAATLAAMLAYFLMGQGDAVGLVTFAEAMHEYLPARLRPGHLRRIMIELQKPSHGQSTDLGAPLEHAARALRRRGLIILVSDMLAPIDALRQRLGLLRAGGHEVIVFQVLDPAEMDFRFEGPALFHDMETQRDLYIDPALARKEYQERFNEHLSAIARDAAVHGADYRVVRTDRPLELALFDYFSARCARRKS